MKNMILVEKYRPQNLDEYISTDEVKQTIREAIKNPKAMPNFLFVSKSPGTGKTSLAYVIKRELGVPNNDMLVTNSSDERKLEYIRGRIKDFAMTMSSTEKPRIVLCDEFDGMRGESQDALRFLMEKYSGNCKFILTANDESKIIEPIISRCVVIRLKDPPREKILERLRYIIEKENIQVDARVERSEDWGGDILNKLIDIYYPDMRSMINEIQRMAPNITLEKIKPPTDLEQSVYDTLKSRKPFDARKIIIDNGINGQDLLKFLWKTMLEDEDLKSKFDYENGESEIWKEKAKQMLWHSALISDRMTKPGCDEDIQLLDWMLMFLDVWK